MNRNRILLALMVPVMTCIAFGCSNPTNSGDGNNPPPAQAGKVWSARSWSFSGRAEDLDWSGTRYAAVGSSSNLFKSSDGLTWVRVSSVGGRSVSFNNGHYVAVGVDNLVFHSTDGDNWTRIDLPLNIRPFRILSIGSGFQAFGWDVSPYPSEKVLLSSADGISWSYGPIADFWSAQAASPNGLVRIGNLGGKITFNGSVVHTIDTSIALIDVIYAGTRFVAVGSKGAIFTSADGVIWVYRNSPISGTVNDLWSIAFSGSIYVAVGTNGTIVTSSDGVTWTKENSGVSTWLTSVKWSGARFVAVGDELVTSP